MFVITCFLPFVRASLPALKENEFKKAKRNEKALSSELNQEPLDFKFIQECKHTILDLFKNKDTFGFTGKSMYVKIH